MPEPSQEKPKQAEVVDRLTTPSSPLIFISHDSRDAELAEAFSKLLSSVSAGVLKSFRSSDRKGTQGIEYGTEWYPELMAKLSAASDIVCLLTPRSLDRPWILYEAGVAKGKLNTSVYGIALGIPLNRAHTGPFAQFQNCDDNDDSLTKLVLQLLSRIPNSEPDREAIQMQVKSFKQKVSEILKKLGDTKDKKDDKSVVDDTSVAKLFEEVKVMFQDLPSRVESRLSDAVDPRRRRSRRFHPMMMEELMHMSSKTGDPVGFLVILSYFRDEMPWLYELGRETYQTIKSGDPLEAEKAMMNFQRNVEMFTHGPFMEEFMDSKDGYMMVRELPRMLDRFFRNQIPISKKQNRKDKKSEE
jgi:hypothetical protein